MMGKQFVKKNENDNPSAKVSYFEYVAEMLLIFQGC